MVEQLETEELPTAEVSWLMRLGIASGIVAGFMTGVFWPY
jgi:hypothetical protein